MSRVSRGCLPCRLRRVKCDQGKPSCERCIKRRMECHGYRDDLSILFRSENEKVVQKVRRTSLDHNLSLKLALDVTTKISSASSRPFLESSSRHSIAVLANLRLEDTLLSNLPNPYPWLKNLPSGSYAPSAEDQVVSQFFNSFVIYPGNEGSTPGFMEHLPTLFGECNANHRSALRWAVYAASYANLSKHQNSAALGDKAMQCYGKALAALARALKNRTGDPDDYCLMTVVVLDLFDTLYMSDASTLHSHAEGMKQILRVRGPEQFYSARGWSLFRLAHHRLQRQQLVFQQEPMPESESWLNNLDENVPYVRIAKHNHEIGKKRKRARALLNDMNGEGLSTDALLRMVKEILELDQEAATWRLGPHWEYLTVPKTNLTASPEALQKLPDMIELHRDIWMTYEWNYHRTARILLHQTLLRCLDSILALSSDPEELYAVSSLHLTSIEIIQALADQVLSTVPQSFGDIDSMGHVIDTECDMKQCRGVGGYFLLWPIKIIKSINLLPLETREQAQQVFERIRETTRMKSAVPELSNI